MTSTWTARNKGVDPVITNIAMAEYLRHTLEDEPDFCRISGTGGDQPPFDEEVALRWAREIRGSIELLKKYADFLEKCGGFTQS